MSYSRLFFLVFITLSLFGKAQENTPNKKIIAHYSFEGNTKDVSGHLIHGYARFPLSYSQGVVGKCAKFNTDSQRIELPHNLARFDLREKAISFWFKASDLRNDINYLLDKMDSSDYSLAINKVDKTLEFWYRAKKKDPRMTMEFYYQLPAIPIKLKKWNFIVINRTDNHLTFFVNGKNEGHIIINNMKTRPRSLYVGMQRRDNHYFFPANKSVGGYRGKIDELIFYDRPLPPEEISDIYEELNKDNEEVSEPVLVVKHNETFQLGNILFNRDKYELLPKAHKNLNKLAGYLIKHKHTKVIITGHTDSKGSSDHNHKLSTARAKEVGKYLISQGVKKRQINTLGMGGSKPIADNNSNDGIIKNRRVEFIISE